MPTPDTINGPQATAVEQDDNSKVESDSAAGPQNPDDGELLIDSMVYVEPIKRGHVPDHLLETKIYTQVGQNKAIHVRPSVIHFDGFEENQKNVRSLTIVNASPQVTRMHIIPPQTKYFDIKYTKSKRMVPGLTLDCQIEFTPDEWRYYYDCIRINCPGEENLVIPIHAYPVMDTGGFPVNFSFSAVPVGHKMSEIFALRSPAPVEFEFELVYLQPHPTFDIEPMSGVVPASGEVNITVTFSPTEYLTAKMMVQLTTSQFNSKPLICSFTGYSSPGLLKELSEQIYMSEFDPEVLDPRCLTPLDRARSKKKKPKQSPKPPKPEPAKEVFYKGIKFSASVVDSPYAVAQVLNQVAGKLSVKDLRQTFMSKKDTKGTSTKQMKEARFEQLVRQNVYEERQNQLRWQVKLGDDQITHKEKQQILDDRNAASVFYKYNVRGDSVPEDEYLRTCSSCVFKRTLRDHTQVGVEGIEFDPYTNDMWAVRHAALNRFQQAARKVIIRLRAAYKLSSLRKVVVDWSRKKYSQALLSEDEKDKIEDEEEKEEIPMHLELQTKKIKRFKFATYIPPNIKDDMAPDALGFVPFIQTEVVVKRKVPYFNLKVPQQYKLLGFKQHNAHNASSGYVAPNLIRPLRTGAEDEIISLPPVPSLIDQVKPEDELVNEGDLTLVDLPEKEVIKEVKTLTLSPPEALFSSIEYPPLHIFNPAPGLQVFLAPLPYAEVDNDFHLCPLPRYIRKDFATNPHAATQRKYLDREDVIRGTMGWKKFPSQGLTSLSNTPTLTGVWVPRWDDQFATELLPQEVSAFLDGLPEDLREDIIDEPEDDGQPQTGGVELTPQMVNAQFSLVESTTDENITSDMFPHGNKMPTSNIPVGVDGPVPREKREQELDYFLTKKYNRLGSKFQSKIQSLNRQISDPDLALK
ncbi:cilia- and flagella-associated protein 221-like [Gigantopelta aegis]|uniref:cilia- and flagella-associated protein 221-like n=1 Tax=Gigantopelta aegis TaxID=1735272 RepID=UPI001B88C4ED|nr:cilia- and flagella-associated protein 221-like [Gigantopelta aegis]